MYLIELQSLVRMCTGLLLTHFLRCTGTGNMNMKCEHAMREHDNRDSTQNTGLDTGGGESGGESLKAMRMVEWLDDMSTDASHVPVLPLCGCGCGCDT